MATETLVLKDHQDNYYVVPRQVIEGCKVTDEKKKQELKQSVEGDTTGFASFGTGIQSFQVGGYKLSPLGSCSCNWSFDQLGRVAR